jgi:Neuraminidase (sialidase)
MNDKRTMSVAGAGQNADKHVEKVAYSIPVVGRRFNVCANANYNAFPDLALSSDGKRLICAWRAGDHHKPARYSGIFVAVSDDRGATWSKPLALGESFDITSLLWNCPSLKVLDDGRIVLLADYSESGQLSENERPPHKIAMFVSDDDGESWKRSDDPPARGLCPDRLFVTSTGAWLLTTQQWKRFAGCQCLVVYVWRSEDHGKTWDGPFICGEQAEYHLCEASVVEPTPGTLVAYMRENSFLGYPVFKSISTDDGKTWTLCQTSIVGGHRPKAGVLQNGQVLITYRFAEGGRNPPANVYAYVEDMDSAVAENRLAQRGRTIPLVHDMHESPDTGYTGWVQFPDGQIIVVNYIRGSSEHAYVHGWSLHITQ